MRKSEILLSLALIGCAATSMWLWNELRAERALNAELSTRPTSLPTPSAVTEAATPVSAPAPAPPAVATPAASFAVTPSARDELSAREEAEASQRQMLQQPKYREAWRAQQRLNYARRRENVIRLLGFTPEEADAVIEIEIDRRLAWNDRALPKAMTREVAQQYQALWRQDALEDQAKLRDLLGEEKSSRYQEYLETRNTRVQVDQLRPQFTGEDTLADDQLEPLIAALHVERTRLHKEQQEYRASARSDAALATQSGDEHELEMLKTAHERIRTAAAPILSSSQLKRLDTLLKRDYDRKELEARMPGSASDTSIAITD